MAFEIEVERAGVGLIPHQRFEHTDHLGAFFVDSSGVEIVDLDKAFGPDRMGERSGIFAKLGGAQGQHIVDPLDRARTHIARELLVAEHGQPLFQAKLEPVAAGDPVARPVVKILMRDDAFDARIIVIGRCFGAGQHQNRVENVQTLILHRACVEIIDRHNIEHVQIVFASIDVFVPFH